MNAEYRMLAFDEREWDELECLRSSDGSPAAQEADYRQHDHDKETVHIICRVAGRMIACASAFEEKKGEYRLYSAVTSETYRRNGHGSGVVKMLESIIKERGAKSLCARAPADLLGFFEKVHLPKCGVTYLYNDERFIDCRRSYVFEDASWLGFSGNKEAVIARKNFVLDEVKKTELIISGLGFCEIYINGKNVSDRLLAPAWTNYVRRDTASMHYPIYDTMTDRILYERLNVTKFLKKGRNTLTVHLGGGWYCQHESRNEDVKPCGGITLCFIMKQGKKTVARSDEDVRYTESFITRQNIYFGEKQDLRLGNYDFSDDSDDISTWKKADIEKEPLALFDEHDVIPDKVIRKIVPKEIFRLGDIRIYDLGELASGYPIVSFSECARLDEVVSLRFADELKDDGGLEFHYCGGVGRMQREEYIYDGKAGEAHQHFTWHACRYIEITGSAEIKEFFVTHTALKKIVRFKSSDPTLQWIFDAYIRTQLDNTHNCIPSDCPHRERLGYTGDGQLASRTVMTCFDAEKMYRKWMRDIADSQDIYNGHVQHTAPFYGGGGGPGGWGGAIVFVPYNFYKFYNDKSVLEEYFPNMLLYLDYMESHSENGLVTHSELGGWCLGDWCSPKNRNLIPPEFVNTYFYIKALSQTAEIADIIGKPSEELKKKCESLKSFFKKTYYNSNTGSFCEGIEACDAYAFDIGLGTKKTLDNIVKKYEALGEFDTGIFGTDILIRTLCENGYQDLAKKLLTSEKENTFYNMKKHGATTLWENWDGCDSRCHPMFGAVVEYIVKYFNEA